MTGHTSQPLDGQPVRIPGAGLIGERLLDEPDACRVDRFDTGVSVWTWCRVHDWFQRQPSGSAAVVACPHRSR